MQNNGFATINELETKLSVFYEDKLVDHFSQTVALNGNTQDTLVFSGVNTAQPGRYDFVAKVNADKDMNPSNDSLNPASSELIVQGLNAIPYEDPGFSDEGWWFDGFWDMGNSLRASLSNEDTATLLSPKVGPLPQNASLILSYSVDKRDAVSDELVGHYLNEGDTIKVLYSSDCGNSFEVIQEITHGNHVASASDSTIQIDMSQYANTEGTFSLELTKGDIGYYVFNLNRFRVHYPQPDVNLAQVLVNPDKCGSANETVKAVFSNNAQFDSLTNVAFTATINRDGSEYKTLSLNYANVLLPGNADTVSIGNFNSELPANYNLAVEALVEDDINQFNNDASASFCHK